MNFKLSPPLLGIGLGLAILVVIKFATKNPTPETTPEELAAPQAINTPSPPDETPAISKNIAKDGDLPPLPNPPKRPDLQKPYPTTLPSEEFHLKWVAIAELPKNQQFNARQKLLGEWVSQYPASALRAFKEAPKEEQPSLMATIGSQWAKMAPRNAAEWALQLPKAHRARVFGNVVSSWADIDKVSALQYAESLPSGEFRNDALKSLAHNWNGPPSQTAEWLFGLPEDQGRNLAILALTTKWSRTGKNAAEAWAFQLQRSDARDHALLGLSRGTVPIDPGKALYYAQQIEKTSIQATQVRSIVNDYARTCIACHRKQSTQGCLRSNLAAFPASVVPESNKTRILNIVQQNLNR